MSPSCPEPQRLPWLSDDLTPEEQDLKTRVEGIAQTHDNDKVCRIGDNRWCTERDPSDPKKPGPHEFAVCNWLGYKCAVAHDAAVAANQKAAQLAEENGWSEKQKNAFQHAYWMAKMRMDGLSEDEILMMAVAHELDHTRDLRTNQPQPYGSPESRRDMYNNRVGLAIGLRIGVSVWEVDPTPEILKAMDPSTCHPPECLATTSWG